MKYLPLIFIAIAASYFLGKEREESKDIEKQEESLKRSATKQSTLATIFGRPPSMFVTSNPQIYQEGQSFFNMKPVYTETTFLPPATLGNPVEVGKTGKILGQLNGTV